MSMTGERAGLNLSIKSLHDVILSKIKILQSVDMTIKKESKVSNNQCET
jgi:hypothetical protein